MLCLSNLTVNLQTAHQAAHMIYKFKVHPRLRVVFSTLVKLVEYQITPIISEGLPTGHTELV